MEEGGETQVWSNHGLYKLLYKPMAKEMGRAMFDHPQRQNHWTDFNKT